MNVTCEEAVFRTASVHWVDDERATEGIPRIVYSVSDLADAKRMPNLLLGFPMCLKLVSADKSRITKTMSLAEDAKDPRPESHVEAHQTLFSHHHLRRPSRVSTISEIREPTNLFPHGR